ncbi:uncharacterized protein LOC106135407 [Amyelois transitella]|uniref:uncharacterized protein LOC106135407 n=1 Tax=Amyelois transitella TaxID=680683 RepID=UPI00067D54C1|nr:uncharacterized protein LOC106135407 [Amyelois transitella]
MPSQYDSNLQNKGWIPLSAEDVMKRIGNAGYLFDYNTPDSFQDMKYLRDNAIKVVTPSYHEFLQETRLKDSSRKINKCNSGACIPQSVEIMENESDIDKFSKKISDQNTIRKPKAIKSDTIIAKSVIHSQDRNLESELNGYLKKDIKDLVDKQETKNTYEVIEDIDQFNTNIEKSNDKTKETNRYENFDTDKNNPQKNFTSSFLDILNRNNIKPVDQSTNYIESRYNRLIIPKQNYMFLQIPLTVPQRYNSPNHLPIDPLVAVFLSNYGYYLPNYYGQRNNYRNLYGYLASNNNHNNLPFGMYKIFSDTDSSY